MPQEGRGGRRADRKREERLVLPDLWTSPLERELLGDKGKLLLDHNSVPKKRREGACCGVAPAGGFGLGGSGCSREGVAAEREGMVRGGRRRRGEQIDDGKGRLQLAKLGEGCRRRRADREQKSSLLLPMVHHGERAREQGEGSNTVEVWAEVAPATRRGAEQGSSSAGGAEREGSGAQGRRVRLRGRRPGTAGCVGNSQRGFS